MLCIVEFYLPHERIRAAAEQMGAIYGFSGTAEGHVGGTMLLNKQTPTRDRSLKDKAINWGMHLLGL